ncbi:hypothetical protein BC833DRAFT_610771 [Globomyces pollinis-pini]|nr:hypothetical protein BC833DRAFT_610771 [Globomyces pollinis-pini]
MNLKKDVKVKKPMNAFFLYRKQMRSKIIKLFNITQSQEISKIAGQLWANEPRIVKSHYKQLALQNVLESQKLNETLCQKVSDPSPKSSKPINIQKNSPNHLLDSNLTNNTNNTLQGSPMTDHSPAMSIQSCFDFPSVYPLEANHISAFSVPSCLDMFPNINHQSSSFNMNPENRQLTIPPPVFNNLNNIPNKDFLHQTCTIPFDFETEFQSLLNSTPSYQPITIQSHSIEKNQSHPSKEKVPFNFDSQFQSLLDSTRVSSTQISTHSKNPVLSPATHIDNCHFVSSTLENNNPSTILNIHQSKYPPSGNEDFDQFLSNLMA